MNLLKVLSLGVLALAATLPAVSIGAARHAGIDRPSTPWSRPDLWPTPLSDGSGDGHGLDRWFWSMPSPQGNTLRAVASNGTVTVAIGDRGTIVSSHGGASWVSRNSPTRADLYDIAWGHGRFVAVGLHGAIVTSTDGFAWSTVPLDPPRHLIDIATDGDRFVAAETYGGTVVTSDDGVAWTVRPSALPSISPQELIWTGDRFVVVAVVSDDGFRVSIFESPDGVQWTQHVVGDRFWPTGMAHNGTTLLVAGRSYDDNAMRTYRSTDGVLWTSSRVTIDYPNEIIAGAGMFVSMGDNRNLMDRATIYRSMNGIDWTPHTFDHRGEVNGARWTGTEFVVVGEDGLIATSTQATDWTMQQTAVQTNLKAVRWLGDEFFAVGSIGPSLRSSDGIDWTPVDLNPSEVDYFGDVARAQTPFGERTVVVGSRGNVRVSSDRVHWDAASMPVSANSDMNAIVWGEYLFVAVGGDGAIATSPNGTDWTVRQTPTFRDLGSVAYGNGMFVAAGSDYGGGVVITSPDAITWTDVYLTGDGEDQGPRDVIWTGEAFVVPSVSRLVVSRDGVDWDVLPSPTPKYEVNKIATDGTRLLSPGHAVWEGTLDGLTWTRRPDMPLHKSDGIASDGKQFISIYSNTVLRTGDDLFADGYQ
jgi:hypothetical protein